MLWDHYVLICHNKASSATVNLPELYSQWHVKAINLKAIESSTVSDVRKVVSKTSIRQEEALQS